MKERFTLTKWAVCVSLILYMVAAFAVLVVSARKFAAQTPPPPARQLLSGGMRGYSIDPQAMAAFSPCLPTDKGCTMEIISCYGVHGAPAGTPPAGCVVLPPAAYDAIVVFERAGGTEVPNGAMSGAVALAEIQVSVQ